MRGALYDILQQLMNVHIKYLTRFAGTRPN